MVLEQKEKMPSPLQNVGDEKRLSAVLEVRITVSSSLVSICHRTVSPYGVHVVHNVCNMKSNLAMYIYAMCTHMQGIKVKSGCNSSVNIYMINDL